MLVAAIGILLLIVGSVMNLFSSFYRNGIAGDDAPVYGIGFLLLIFGLIIAKPGPIDRNVK